MDQSRLSTPAATAGARPRFNGRALRDGAVGVFDLDGDAKSTRADAWSFPIDGSPKRRFFAVLHFVKIQSPVDAARAAIIVEHKVRPP
jgi:hypothetical protein